MILNFGGKATSYLVSVSCRAEQNLRSVVAPDGGSLDPVCCVFGVKRGRSRADVCSHQQPDLKSGFVFRAPESLARKVLLSSSV